MAHQVKNLSAKQEIQYTWVGYLGWEDPLKGMASHSSILAWRIPQTEEPGGLQPLGSQQSDTTEHTALRPWFLSAPCDSSGVAGLFILQFGKGSFATGPSSHLSE